MNWLVLEIHKVCLCCNKTGSLQITLHCGSFIWLLLLCQCNCAFRLCCRLVAVNNIKLLCVAMETQEVVPFALFSNCLMFRTAVNSINITSLCVSDKNILRSSRKVPDIAVRF